VQILVEGAVSKSEPMQITSTSSSIKDVLVQELSSIIETTPTPVNFTAVEATSLHTDQIVVKPTIFKSISTQSTVMTSSSEEMVTVLVAETITIPITSTVNTKPSKSITGTDETQIPKGIVSPTLTSSTSYIVPPSISSETKSLELLQTSLFSSKSLETSSSTTLQKSPIVKHISTPSRQESSSISFSIESISSSSSEKMQASVSSSAQATSTTSSPTLPKVTPSSTLLLEEVIPRSTETELIQTTVSVEVSTLSKTTVLPSNTVEKVTVLAGESSTESNLKLVVYTSSSSPVSTEAVTTPKKEVSISSSWIPRASSTNFMDSTEVVATSTPVVSTTLLPSRSSTPAVKPSKNLINLVHQVVTRNLEHIKPSTTTTTTTTTTAVVVNNLVKSTSRIAKLLLEVTPSSPALETTTVNENVGASNPNARKNGKI